MRLQRSIIFLLTFAVISCDRGPVIEPVEPDTADAITNQTFPNVDERLWEYFRSFEVEAQARGLSFDLKALNILGVIQNIDQQGVAGHCKFGSHIDNEVTIDNGFWARANAATKEFVVFHELGHCVLLRDHDETSLSNGVCASIMRSGVEECRDDYNQTTRKQYLDELFSMINV